MLGPLILACWTPPAGDTSAPAEDVAVSIQSVDWDCSADDDQWTFAVETTGWTDGGLLAMTADARRVEAHEMLSVEAAVDGSWDRLELELDIVADTSDAEDGKSSAWLCDARTLDELAFRLSVSERTGGTIDCRVWGVETDWNALAGYSECTKSLEE
ncbi:MAG: hypothetical protein GY913_33175 [Proteobacteria bacterium]|nr:hypothetical protein [Pseudomonadota bacterium]MCP4921778.1 hypothetical protein [Pseudomonadota bacterium]